MHNNIYKSLNEIYEILKLERLEKKKNELYDANRFNPFQFMKTDENGLSTILAFLLDPKEKHGQQDLFLNSLLKYIKRWDFLAYDQIVVTREKETRDRRRQDIFIEGWLNKQRKWIISIENKLKGAIDQDNQLIDYYKDLETYGVPFSLIYLPPTNCKPTEKSIENHEWDKLVAENKARILDASDLIKWLENTPILAPNIINFCNDFKRYLKDNIMNETEEMNKLVEQLITNPTWVNTAITLIESSDVLYERLGELLIEQLQEEFKTNYPKMVSYGWYFNTTGYSSGFYLGKGDIDKQYWGIGIEFSRSSNCSNAYYGIWATKEKIDNKYYENLRNIFNLEGFKNSDWWLHWKYCDFNLRNWNAETWADIPNKKLAKQIFELLKPLIDIANKNIDVL